MLPQKDVPHRAVRPVVRRVGPAVGVVRGSLRRRRLRPRAAGTGAGGSPVVRPGRQHPHGPRWQDAAGAGLKTKLVLGRFRLKILMNLFNFRNFQAKGTIPVQE